MSLFNKIVKSVSKEMGIDKVVNKATTATKTVTNNQNKVVQQSSLNKVVQQSGQTFQQQIDAYEAANPGVLKLVVRKSSEDPGITLAGVNKLINNEIFVPSIVSKVYSFGNWIKESADIKIVFEDASKLSSSKEMFAKSEFNNLDVSNWNLNEFNSIRSLFMKAKIKNLKGIDKWNLGKHTDLTQLFIFAKIDNIEGINYLDVSNVQSLTFAFRELETNTLDLSNWNIKNLVTTPNTTGEFGKSVGVFQDCKINKLIGIENWDVSNLTCLIAWFFNASINSLDLSRWNVSKVENMSFLFEGYKGQITGINNWDVSNVKIMRKTFYSTKTQSNIDLSNWNVSKVENMNRLFGYTSMNNQNLSNWNVSNVLDMENIFNKCAIASVGDLSNWNVSKVKNFSFAFSQSEFTDVGLIGNWNVSNADVTQMFGRSKLTNIGSISNWKNNIHQDGMMQGSLLKK